MKLEPDRCAFQFKHDCMDCSGGHLDEYGYYHCEIEEPEYCAMLEEKANQKKKERKKKTRPVEKKKSFTVLDCFMTGATIAGVFLFFIPFSFEQVEFGLCLIALGLGYLVWSNEEGK